MDGPPVLLGGKLAQFLEKHMGVQPDDKYSEKALGVSGLEVTTSEDCFFPLALEPGWPISTVFVFSHSNSFYQSQRGSLELWALHRSGLQLKTHGLCGLQLLKPQV